MSKAFGITLVVGGYDVISPLLTVVNNALAKLQLSPAIAVKLVFAQYPKPLNIMNAGIIKGLCRLVMLNYVEKLSASLSENLLKKYPLLHTRSTGHDFINSHSNIAAAAAALKDSVRPLIGMVMRRSQRVTISSVRPLASLPTKTAHPS